MKEKNFSYGISSKFPSSASLANEDVASSFLPLPAGNDNLWRPFDRDDLFTTDPDLRKFQDPDECRNLFYSERGEHESIFPTDITYEEYDAVYNKLARLSILLDGADKHLHVMEIERAIMNIVGPQNNGNRSSGKLYQGSVVYVYIANKNGYKHILPSGCVKCVVTIWTKGTFGRDCLRPIESLIDFCDRGMLRVLGRTLRVIQVGAAPVLNSFINGIAEYRVLHNSVPETTATGSDLKASGVDKMKGAWKKPLTSEHFSSPLASDASDGAAKSTEAAQKPIIETTSNSDSISPIKNEASDKQKEPVKNTDIKSTESENVTMDSAPTKLDAMDSPSQLEKLDLKSQQVAANESSKDNEEFSDEEGDIVFHSDGSGKMVKIISEISTPADSLKIAKAIEPAPVADQGQSTVLKASIFVPTKTSNVESVVPPTKPTESAPNVNVPTTTTTASSYKSATTNKSNAVAGRSKVLVFADEKDSSVSVMDTLAEPSPSGLIRPDFHYERLTDSVINDCLFPLFTQHQALQNSLLKNMQQMVTESLVYLCSKLPDSVLQNLMTNLPALPKPLLTHSNNSNVVTGKSSAAGRNSHLIFYHDHRIVSVISPYFRYRVHQGHDNDDGIDRASSCNVQSYYGMLLAPHDHLEDLWRILCHIRYKLFIKKQKEQQVQRQRLKRASQSLIDNTNPHPHNSSAALGRSRSIDEGNQDTLLRSNSIGVGVPELPDTVSDDGDEFDKNQSQNDDDSVYSEDGVIDEEDDDDDDENSAMTEKERMEKAVSDYLERSTAIVVKLYTDQLDTTVETSGSKTGASASMSASSNFSSGSAFCSLTQETMNRNLRGRPGVLEYMYIGKYVHPLPVPVVGNVRANPSNVNLVGNSNPSIPSNASNSKGANDASTVNSLAAPPLDANLKKKKNYRDILVTELPVLTLRHIIDYLADTYPLTSASSIESDYNLTEVKYKLSKALCLALSALHVGENIVHRDLRPETCVIMNDGTLRVSDFNLAKRMNSSSANSHSGANTGSQRYVAPEVLSSLLNFPSLPIDERFMIITKAGDIYALGAILYELFTHGDMFSSMHMKKLHHPFFYLQHPDRMQSASGSTSTPFAGSTPSVPPSGLPPMHPFIGSNPSSAVHQGSNTLWPPLSHVHLYIHQPWFLHLLYHCLEEDPGQRPNISQIMRHPWYLSFSVNFDVLLVRELNEVLIRDYHAVYDANFVKRLRLLKPIESMLNFAQLNNSKDASSSGTGSGSYAKKSGSVDGDADSSSLSSYYYRHHPAGNWVSEVDATQIASFITLGHEYNDLLPDMVHFPTVAATGASVTTSEDVASPYRTEGMDSGSVRLKAGKPTVDRGRERDRDGSGSTIKRSRSRSSSIDRNLSTYGKFASNKERDSRGWDTRDRGERDGSHNHRHGGRRDYDDYDDRDETRDRGGDRGRYRGRDDDDNADDFNRRNKFGPGKATNPGRGGREKYASSGALADDDEDVRETGITSEPVSTATVLFVPYPLPKLSLFLRFVRNLKTHYHGLEELQRLMRAAKQHVILPMRALLKSTYAYYYSHYVNPAQVSTADASLVARMGEVLDDYVRYFQQEKLTYEYPADVFTHHPAINWLLPEIWRQSVLQYRQWKIEGEEIEARRQHELSEINVFANL